jgi:hypothetical protein
MLDKRVVLGSKDETTYNTDSVPTAAANAVLVEDVKWAFAGSRMFQRNPVRASLAKLAPVYAGTLITVSGKVEIKGSGVAGTAPEIAPLLRGAGFAETLVGGTSATYKPTSTQSNHKSQSMYFYDDGLLLKMTGAMIKPSFDLSVGKAGFMSFEATGHFVSITDVALPAATYVTAAPPVLINVPFTIGAYAAIITKLAFDMGVRDRHAGEHLGHRRLRPGADLRPQPHRLDQSAARDGGDEELHQPMAGGTRSPWTPA